MSYYFQPTGQVYSSSQIQGMVGINPESADDEVLNHHGIFKVVQNEGEQDSFVSPFHVEYKIEGCKAYEISSGVSISLEEAKSKAKESVILRAEKELSCLQEISGFPPEVFRAVLQYGTDSSLRDKASDIVLQLEESLREIQEMPKVEDLRKFCTLT